MDILCIFFEILFFGVLAVSMVSYIVAIVWMFYTLFKFEAEFAREEKNGHHLV